MNIIQDFDKYILNYINEHMTNIILDKIMIFITTLGNGGILWILLALFFIFIKKDRKTGIKMALALILCFLTGNLLLKNLVGRIRPFDINSAIEILIKKPLDFSFPSGHTMTSFASAIVIYSKYKRAGIFTIILATLIAFSRMYLYVHYPSDIICGLIIGIIIAMVSIKTVDLKFP